MRQILLRLGRLGHPGAKPVLPDIKAAGLDGIWPKVMNAVYILKLL